MNHRYKINELEFLQLSEKVISIFQTRKQTGRRKEAGGILLGTVYPEQRVLIKDATVPGYLDMAGRYFFDRSRGRAQHIVNKHWKKSSGECIYLGEWHTHPEPSPSPSCRDRQMIRNMFNQTKMEIEFLFLIIVGTQSIWIAIENGFELRPLNAITDDNKGLQIY